MANYSPHLQPDPQSLQRSHRNQGKKKNREREREREGERENQKKCYVLSSPPFRASPRECLKASPPGTTTDITAA